MKGQVTLKGIALTMRGARVARRETETSQSSMRSRIILSATSYGKIMGAGRILARASKLVIKKKTKNVI